MLTDLFIRESLNAVRVEDDTATGITYVAKSAPGSIEAKACWQIQRVTKTVVGTVTTTKIEFPNGDNTYRYAWSDRASLTYS